MIRSLSFLFALIATAPAPAFERTEDRAPCADHDPLRRPFFGDTHVHTALSFDAMGQGTRTGPRDAYRFARGEEIGLPPYRDDEPLNRARLRRPLDFAAVTDHSELVGETQICQDPSLPGHRSLVCVMVRRWPRLGYAMVNGHVYSHTPPRRYGFCGEDGRHCREAASGPWRAIQDAAEEFYDRSSTCRFTTFVGYEWTGMPGGDNIHRNILFRNEVVQTTPTNYIETPTAEGLWRALLDECIETDTRCDAIAIPHNSNVSNGMLFRVETEAGQPLRRADAELRARLETLVEVTQHKGDSECRINANDELCGFETVPFRRMMDMPRPSIWGEPPPLSYVREVLGAGVVEFDRIGANPFKFGLIGSTDTHFSTPGMVDEDTYLGHGAGLSFARHGILPFPDQPHFNPGGLAVVWAEENSRDSLFAAMRRREAYGTSGPRMVVRFFGGWNFSPEMCADPDFAALGYAGGVPMGGDLPPPSGDAPTFAVWALRDPGGNGAPSTPLQRVQIVKMWADAGEWRERVYDVAGDANNGAGVDLATCQTHGPGSDSLCTVWRDPDFDPGRPATYYARVVENPSCRWSTWACLRHGVDCTRRETFRDSLRHCCDEALPKTIQERAWTSPIWYEAAVSTTGSGDGP